MLRRRHFFFLISVLFVVVSYEEHLKMMVLKEEFFPLMEEVKNSIALMIKGANGNMLPKCS